MTTDELIDALLKRADDLSREGRTEDADLMNQSAALLTGMVSLLGLLQKGTEEGSFWQ